MQAYVHPTAVLEDNVTLNENVKIWHFCHVRKGAILHKDVSLAKDVFVDCDVEIGQGSRIQNGVSIYHGVRIMPWCFVGPHVIFTNDMYPRVGNKNWSVTETLLLSGCAIGAGAIIRCGVELGEFSMIAAGSVVTRSVRPFHLAVGLPAKESKMVCACGQSQFKLKTKFDKLIQPCCKENLSQELLQLAQTVVARNLKTEIKIKKSRVTSKAKK